MGAAIEADGNAQESVALDMGSDGGVPSPSPEKEREVIPRSACHSSPCARSDHGKERLLRPSRSGGRSHGKGKGREIEEGTGCPPNAYGAEREAGVHRAIKAEHCAARLITIIVSKYREEFVDLSARLESKLQRLPNFHLFHAISYRTVHMQKLCLSPRSVVAS